LSLLELLRRYPGVDQVATIVDAADAAIEADPSVSREHLRDLGRRPWFRAPDHNRIAYGFALRAYAAWLQRDMPAALSDLRGVIGLSPAADPLLPLVPVLSGGSGAVFEDQAQLVADRFGRCGRPSCGHPIGLEAVLALIRQADDVPALVRCTKRMRGLEHEAPVRIASFARAWQLGAGDDAEQVLDGPGERLQLARARVAYETGKHARVIEMLPVEHELAVRSTLARLLQGETVPEANLEALASRAEHDSSLAALLDEANGHYGDAAVAWKVAGDPARTWEAEALAGARGAGPPPAVPGLHMSTVWYAHAAGSAPRPDVAPTTAVDHHNADVGVRRVQLERVRAGGSLADPSETETQIARLLTVLEILGEEPGRAASMLAASSPEESPAELLDSLATAPRKAGSTAGAQWEAWSEAHHDVAPLPRRARPIRWLTIRQGLALPMREDLDPLPHEQRLPVLAAIVETGAAWASAAACESLTTAALRTALPQALPDLPALAAAVAARSDLDPAARRHASMVAGSALANGVARGAWTEEAAAAATGRVTATVADLLPDPDQLSPDEAFRIDSEALASFSKTARRRAIGPVLRLLADLPVPASVPSKVSGLYTAEPAVAMLLLKAGRPDAARRAFGEGLGTDTALAAEIAAAVADRHLAAKRPVDALHELATVPNAKDLAHIDRELLDRVASGVVRERGNVPIDTVLHDADVLLTQVPDLPSVTTMVVELLLARTNNRPGSAALDVADLERAYEIDQTHPMVKRSLSFALVVRGMESAETQPTQAVADVDRATDLYMADAELAEMAAKVALHAGAILWGKHRNRAAASRAIEVSLSINPRSTDALTARRVVRGY
jgi:hypothetical protein